MADYQDQGVPSVRIRVSIVIASPKGQVVLHPKEPFEVTGVLRCPRKHVGNAPRNFKCADCEGETLTLSEQVGEA